MPARSPSAPAELRARRSTAPYLITPSASDGSTTLLTNYDVTYNTANFTITKKSATVSAVANTKVYGSSDPALATTDSGFEAADWVPARSPSAPAELPARRSTAAPYLITPSATDGSTTLLTNYNVTYNTANFTITKKSATVSAVANTKVYGSADPALGTTDSGFEAADLGAGKITFSASRAGGRDGQRQPVPDHPSATDGSTTLLTNYNVTYNTANFTITKKSATVSAVANTKVYGSADPALGTHRQRLRGRRPGCRQDHLQRHPSSGETVNGSPYLITPSASDGATTLLTNYDVTYNTANFAITKKSATVSAVANTKVYGSADPALGTTDSGFEAADLGAGKITFSASRARARRSTAAPYLITPSASDGSTTLLTNYNVTYNTANFSITKKSATVSAVANTKVYGSADPALATTDSGFEAADLGAGKITFSATRAGARRSTAAPYLITPSATDGATTLLTNYNVTYNTANFTITKKSATVSAVANTKVYGAQTRCSPAA